MKGAKAVGKMAPDDLVDAGLPRTFNLLKKKTNNQKKTVSVKHDKTTYNKTRYAVMSH